VTTTPKKPWWVLTRSRGGAWFYCIFYTVFAAFQLVTGALQGHWWGWALGVGFLLLAAAAWPTLVWVHRHPDPADRPRANP